MTKINPDFFILLGFVTYISKLTKEDFEDGVLFDLPDLALEMLKTIKNLESDWYDGKVDEEYIKNVLKYW